MAVVGKAISERPLRGEDGGVPEEGRAPPDIVPNYYGESGKKRHLHSQSEVVSVEIAKFMELQSSRPLCDRRSVIDLVGMPAGCGHRMGCGRPMGCGHRMSGGHHIGCGHCMGCGRRLGCGHRMG